MKRLPLTLLVCLIALPLTAAEFELKKTDDGVTVNLDGELFTKYDIKNGPKPYLWPVIGPTGAEYTRAYPMKKKEGERNDHPHHRSIWFTHGDVNGIDFWSEGAKSGKTVHQEYKKVQGGKQGVLTTVNDWTTADGKKVLEDERTYTFHTDGKARYIDFDITLKATAGDVKFGDTKEGTMGIRVAGSMKVDAKMGGKLVNSDGKADKAAWGTQSPWVDYYGPVEGKTAGVAILNHPASFRYPTHWHVRTYGLFAANPFGLHHFKGVKEHIGEHVLKKGDSLSFRYRIILHEGDAKEADIAGAFKKYAAEK